MKKPSMKNKLTADKIEEANRLLAEQNKTENLISEAKLVKPNSIIEKVSTPQTEKIAFEKEIAIEKPAIKVESKKPKTKVSSKQTLIQNVKEIRQVRVTIDVPEDLHEKLKIKMILSKQTIKDYLLNYIEKDLGKMDYKF